MITWAASGLADTRACARLGCLGILAFGLLVIGVSYLAPFDVGDVEGYLAVRNGSIGWYRLWIIEPDSITDFFAPDPLVELRLGALLGICIGAGLLFVVLSYCGRGRRDAVGICACCGYDLRGNTSGICPECGTPIPEAMQKELPTNPRNS